MWRHNVAPEMTSLTIVYSTVYSGTDQRKYQSSASLAFVRETHWWSVYSPHKEPVTRKLFPFDDVIMLGQWLNCPKSDLKMSNENIYKDISEYLLYMDHRFNIILLSVSHLCSHVLWIKLACHQIRK